MRNLILLALLLLPVSGWATITQNTEYQYIVPKNILKNPGFENGKTGWAATGGTFVTTTTASNVFAGASAGAWTPSASSQKLQSSLYTTLPGQNCLGRAQIKGGDTTYSLQVLDNSGNILGTTSLATYANYTPVNVPFQCPSSGQVRIVLLAGNSSPPQIFIDDAYLGQNYFLTDISQAQFYGAVTSPTTASCSWNGGSSGTFTNYSAVAACPVATAEGNATAPATKIPAIRFPNGLSPGRYLFTVSGDFYLQNTGSGNCNWTVSDGNTNVGEAFQSSFTSGQGFSASVITGSFNYSNAQGDTTLQVQAQFNGTITSCNIDVSSAGNTFRIEVYKFPSTTQQAVGMDKQGWHVDATVAGGTNPDLGPSAVPNYVDIQQASLSITANAGSVPVQIGCSSTNPPTGSTCSAGTPDVSVAFTPLTTGPALACVSFAHEISTVSGGAIDATFQLVQTPINAQTITASANSFIESENRISSSLVNQPHRICGPINFTSVQKTLLRLMYVQTIGGGGSASNVILTDQAGNTGRSIHWEVYPINQGIANPVVLNTVVSANQSPTRVENAVVTCGLSPALITNPGGWITSIVPPGVGHGECVITFTNPFGAIPACTCSVVDVSEDANTSCYLGASPSTTSVYLRTVIAGSLTNADATLICSGPR